MLENRIVIAAADNGIKYELNLNNPQDNEIYYGGCYEPTVVRVIKKYVGPGMTVFDIGAHSGSHTLRFAKIVSEKGKVIAIEPDDKILLKLERNLRLNNFNNIIVEKIAFSDANREDKEITLDEYVKKNKVEKIDFMKIDTDGYEYKIIKGGLNSLKKFRPIMVMEFTKVGPERYGDNLEDLIDLLGSSGYSIFSDRSLKEYKNKESILDAISPGAVINVLLKPTKK